MRILWAAVIVLGVGMLLLGLRYYGVSWPLGDDAYYAVYLDSGDVYFGHLSYFPRLTLKGAHFLMRDEERVTISSFKEAAWGPEDKLYLNPDNVLWTVKLRSDSPVLDLLKGIGPSTMPPPVFDPGTATPSPVSEGL
jgi:hypothetical protein